MKMFVEIFQTVDMFLFPHIAGTPSKKKIDTKSNFNFDLKVYIEIHKQQKITNEKNLKLGACFKYLIFEYDQ